MGTKPTYLINLNEAKSIEQVGRKAWSLKSICAAGLHTQTSYCLTTDAYELFLSKNNLHDMIEIELGRKSIDQMRWEELWDCGLRIRHAIQQAVLPANIMNEITSLNTIEPSIDSWAIRSSSPHEDMHNASFAGLYESYLHCNTITSIKHAILNVWASLWSNRALLYRHEIALDPTTSRMSILLQEMIEGEVSGVAFSQDPNNAKLNHIIIEAVPGLCDKLVDGTQQPDQIKINRDTQNITQNQANSTSTPIPACFNKKAILELSKLIIKIEKKFGKPVDIEWTFLKNHYVVLQARPINFFKDSNRKRIWYLSLTPNDIALKHLEIEVTQKLIPLLKDEGDRMQLESIETLNDIELANTIESRANRLKHWRKIYIDKFIPFAHGVRHFAQYYNDVVKPVDPYEFTILLETKQRIAQQRLKQLTHCAKLIENDHQLKHYLQSLIDENLTRLNPAMMKQMHSFRNGEKFISEYQQIKKDYFDITFSSQRLLERDDTIISLLLQYASHPFEEKAPSQKKQLEENFLKKTTDIHYAKHTLSTARLSWQLRDDDNLLLSRIESQLLAAIYQARQRLIDNQRIDKSYMASECDAQLFNTALKDKTFTIPKKQVDKNKTRPTHQNLIQARQLKGQPAVPGIISGYAKHIIDINDINHFTAGDIIICSAIDPSMTHIVPLAKAIVEERGGMLIHGVIIARELGIPCVNGISQALEYIQDRTYITVDGTQGLVIINNTSLK